MIPDLKQAPHPVAEPFSCFMEVFMLIEVTKLNDSKLLINTDAVELVEETPDTVVIFRSGRKIIIKESRQEIKNLVKS